MDNFFIYGSLFYKYKLLVLQNIEFFNPATNQVIVEKGIPFSEKKICHRAKIVTEANRGELVKNSNDYGLLLKYVK